MDSIRNPFFASAVATVDRVLAAQVNSIFSTQILNNLKPEDIGAVSVLSRQYSTATLLTNVNTDQLITTFAFPGGCLGNTGFLEFNIWMTHTASITPKRIRMWLNNSPTTTSLSTRLVSFQQNTVDNIATMRAGTIFLTGAPNAYITQPTASGGTGATGSTFTFMTGTLNTSLPFYMHIALQKDEVSPGVWDTVTFRYARCLATYGA